MKAPDVKWVDRQMKETEGPKLCGGRRSRNFMVGKTEDDPVALSKLMSEKR